MKEKNTGEKYEDASDNKSNTKKYSSVSAIVVNLQEKVDIYNHHIIITVPTYRNNKKYWKTIYEVIDEK